MTIADVDKGARTANSSGTQGAAAVTQPTTQLRVDGMSCAHCVTAVDRALRAVPGVTDVSVDLAAGRASVRGEADSAALAAAVAAEGYTVTPQGDPQD